MGWEHLMFAEGLQQARQELKEVYNTWHMLGPNEKRLSLMVASVCSCEQAGQGWAFVRKGLPGFLLGQPVKTLESGRPKDFRTRNSPVFGKVVDSIGSVMKSMRFSSHTQLWG